MEKSAQNSQGSDDESGTANKTQTHGYLKTSDRCFKKYGLSLQNTIINFTRKSKSSGELVVAHSTSIDGSHIKMGSGERCPHTKGFYHSVVIVLPSGLKRILYFESPATSQKWVNLLLKLQGFESQINQYQLDEEPM